MVQEYTLMVLGGRVPSAWKTWKALPLLSSKRALQPHMRVRVVMVRAARAAG